MRPLQLFSRDSGSYTNIYDNFNCSPAFWAFILKHHRKINKKLLQHPLSAVAVF